METLKVLMIGDLVAEVGRKAFYRKVSYLKEKYSIDAIIVNGENSGEKGKGITPAIVLEFKQHGVDIITTGNHIWQKNEIHPFLNERTDLIRPINYPSGCPGKGITFFNCKGYLVAVMNLIGRVFMHDHVDCPFKAAESALSFAKHKTNIILVDFHAETTSEKLALAYFLDGKVSAVVGTHTHVQTADERILPLKTAYITDLGMCGSLNSMIGMKIPAILNKYLTSMPAKHEVADYPPYLVNGVVITIDCATGHALKIERVKEIDNGE